KFTDGSPVTADDFLWSYQILTSQTPPNSGVVSLKAAVDSVTSTDPTTVTVKLKQPSVLGMFEFGGAATSKGWLVASHAAFDKMGQDAFRANPVLTGPFKPSKHVTGQYVEFEANEFYWNPELVPRIKT